MTSYLDEHEAKTLQNGDVHLTQIPDIWIWISRVPFEARRTVMLYFFFFGIHFKLFNLTLTYF